MWPQDSDTKSTHHCGSRPKWWPSSQSQKTRLNWRRHLLVTSVVSLMYTDVICISLVPPLHLQMKIAASMLTRGVTATASFGRRETSWWGQVWNSPGQDGAYSTWLVCFEQTSCLYELGMQLDLAICILKQHHNTRGTIRVLCEIRSRSLDPLFD